MFQEGSVKSTPCVQVVVAMKKVPINMGPQIISEWAMSNVFIDDNDNNWLLERMLKVIPFRSGAWFYTPVNWLADSFGHPRLCSNTWKTLLIPFIMFFLSLYFLPSINRMFYIRYRNTKVSLIRLKSGDLGGHSSDPPRPAHHSRKVFKKAQTSSEKCGGPPSWWRNSTLCVCMSVFSNNMGGSSCITCR